VFLSQAVEVPNTANVRFHHLTTVNPTMNGGISRVIIRPGDPAAPRSSPTRHTSPTFRDRRAHPQLEVFGQ
jgi:hypothetical protein